MSFTPPEQGNPQGPDPAAEQPNPVAPAPANEPQAPAPTSAPTPAPAPAPDTAPAPPPVDSAPAPAPDHEPAPAPSDADLAEQVRALAAQLEELQQKTTRGQLSLVQTDEELAQKIDDLREQFAEWPQRGGMGEGTPQPWDLQGHELPAPGVTRDYLPGGAPDEISPVVVAHNKPLLAPGTAGTAVAELAQLLKALGYETSISKGINHAFSFDDTIASAIATFKRDFHVFEDPSQFPPQGTHVDTVVGPWIWEALIRAAKLVEKKL